jgi:hypothetical protein
MTPATGAAVAARGAILSAQDAVAVPAPCFLLTLDADGVYFGATQIHPEDVKEGDVVLDHLPDNAPGRYRWDRAAAALHPLPVSQHKETAGAPDLERAFDALCGWLSDNDSIPLPPLIAEWRAGYAKSIDQKKTVD